MCNDSRTYTLWDAEWLEVDVVGRECSVQEGSLDSVKVVCANGNQRALAADVLVQLLLQINEAIISLLRHHHTTPDIPVSTGFEKSVGKLVVVQAMLVEAYRAHVDRRVPW